MSVRIVERTVPEWEFSKDFDGDTVVIVVNFPIGWECEVAETLLDGRVRRFLRKQCAGRRMKP